MSAPTIELITGQNALVIGGAAGRIAYLTEAEFKVAAALVTDSGKLVSREALTAILYPAREAAPSNVLQVIVYRLRKKLQEAGDQYVIVLKRKAGYVLRARGSA